MLFATIKRDTYGKRETLGKFTLEGWGSEVLLNLETLELPWKNNENGESCIPEGEYEVRIREAEESGTFDYKHLKVYDPDLEKEVIKGNGYKRKYILFHSGNYYTQIEGCILLGKERADINGDGIIDITDSRDSLRELISIMEQYEEDRFQLKIYS
jgi:hypothetical protein